MKNGTKNVPRRFLLERGTKVKLMPPKSEEYSYCFEILIGGTSKRHYIALATYDIFESWLYALREFIPSVMSHLRSLRVKVMGSNDEALEDYKPNEVKLLQQNWQSLTILYGMIFGHFEILPFLLVNFNK